jgi:large subunit ribosomal protein L13
MPFRTYAMRKEDIKKDWILIDATDLVLGRLASTIAMVLRGKHKPTFTPHVDCGDNIVVINADKIHITGNKMDRKDGKVYYRHTGYPGGIKSVTAGKILEGKHPERVLWYAVRRMITRNKLSNKQMANLHIYGGSEHPHAAQQPKLFDFAGINSKNVKR